MSQPTLTTSNASGKRLLDSLQMDLRNISSESKRRHPTLKEAAEAGIVKLRSVSNKHPDLRLALLSESPELLEPFCMACETKIPKMVQIALNGIQRLITYEAVSSTATVHLINCLWNLMENEIEELKLLQTMTLLISTNDIVQGETLAKGLALCFRLHFTKNQTVNNTASATIRQLVSFVFERVQTEDKTESPDAAKIEVNYEELKVGSKNPPQSLRPAARDAFALFQDLVQLVNGDQPFWLMGLIEMTRTFGLELLESIFSNSSDIFFRHEEFSFLLKEKVCPLVIKLFSPNIKYKPHLSMLHQLHQHQQQQQQQQQQSQQDAQQNNSNFSDKPMFPISTRLLRIVTVLVQNFYSLLITECEIFLSLLIKFLEADKPNWQRALALEVIHKMSQQPVLLKSFCQFYDMKPNSSKIFRDIIIALGVYCQSIFISPPITPSLLSSLINAASAASSSNTPPNTPNANQINSSSGIISPQPAFLLRGTWVPIISNLSTGQNKSYFLDQMDKLEAPPVPDGYGLTTALHCFFEIVQSISIIIDGPSQKIEIKEKEITNEKNDSFKHKLANVNNLEPEVRNLHEAILNSSWSGLVASLALLLDASTDETVTDSILKTMEKLTALYGLYNLTTPRDAIITAMCKTSLPIGYNLSILSFKIPTASEGSSPASLTPSASTGTLASNLAGCHSRSSSFDLSNHWATSNINLLSNNSSLLQQTQPPPNSLSSNLYLRGTPQSESSDFRQQVVAVGTPLPSASSSNSSSQGPVMLTAKNLQCMKAILAVAHSYGFVLGSSWHLILTTLQHLAWILDLKPTTGGSLKVGKPGTEAGASTSSLITTAAMSDLPVLSAMLSRLFESSQELDDAALLHLVEALCKLSNEAMEMAYNNREPSLFAVAKMLETGLVNLKRYKTFWTPMTDHLLKVCQHPQLKMREWGAEALTCLVKNALTLKNLEIGEKFKFLKPLQDMSYINHIDMRQKQLDCVIQILQSSGDTISEGWPQILDIIGAINENQSESLIRISFQCLQLIIRDFLSSIPAVCLVLVVDTIAKFGSQTQELNVSLTAVSSLWDTADYLFSNRKMIAENLEDEVNVDPDSQIPAYDCLWMSLFTKLGDLCTDTRPSLRKSASQTLFATLSTHGEILDSRLWSSVLWKVLFPLLDRVRNSSNTASSDKITEVSKSMGISGIGVNGNTGSILLHHSRNTAQKQWSETQVLTLSGVSRIFSLKRDQFVSTIDDFEKAWILLLDHIETSAQSKNSEVSISALKCFQDILSSSYNISTGSTSSTMQSVNNSINGDTTGSSSSGPLSTTSATTNPPSIPLDSLRSHKTLWIKAWKVWLNIGTQCLKSCYEESCDNGVKNSHSLSNASTVNVASMKQAKSNEQMSSHLPSQTFLASLIQIFPFLLQLIKDSFSTTDFTNLFSVLEKALAVPVDVATQAYMMSSATTTLQEIQSGSVSQIPVTPLQESILFVMETFQNDIVGKVSRGDSSNSWESLLPLLINQYLNFSLFACHSPATSIVTQYLLNSTKKYTPNADWTMASLVPFGERCLRSALILYQHTASWKSVIKGNILHSFIKALKIPLSMKYTCPSQSTWKLAHQTLLNCLSIGLPIARQFSSDFVSLWADLASTLETFLFSNSKPPLNQSLEEQQCDEILDVKVVELIRDNILPHAGQMPKEFVLQIVSILNKGSIHSATNGSPIDTESTRKLREEFARCCFDTLLQFSFLGPKGNPNLFIQAPNLSTPGSALSAPVTDIGLVNKLVVTSLLQRFHEVVIKYVEDEKLSGKCPLPRHRMAEISFVLQALATLTSSMKKAPPDTVEHGVWEQMISLYPHLVDCTMSNCAQVNRALREVLHEYKDLLHPPSHIKQNNNQKIFMNSRFDTRVDTLRKL
ncbi:protein MON2 homolog isoform X3 [Tetranychus urticae]|uniref:protein MON2 homolog isoform X3 n=1 Tax=Tetranychus urticae TaxID=32264 RepID=UPI00077BB794|nr:protein MON2 homolog isoform X3 [Tetranychus urticae]